MGSSRGERRLGVLDDGDDRSLSPVRTRAYDAAMALLVRRSLDRHATYIVSTFIAGATLPG